jgi:hypothetical protein
MEYMLCSVPGVVLKMRSLDMVTAQVHGDVGSGRLEEQGKKRRLELIVWLNELA